MQIRPFILFALTLLITSKASAGVFGPCPDQEMLKKVTLNVASLRPAADTWRVSHRPCDINAEGEQWDFGIGNNHYMNKTLPENEAAALAKAQTLQPSMRYSFYSVYKGVTTCVYRTSEYGILGEAISPSNCLTQ